MERSRRLDGLVLLAPAMHGDERGFFMETFRADAWAAHGVADRVRAGQPLALAPRHRCAGMHFQTSPGQGKLVRVARGRVLDVVVDLRRGSPTFGEWEARRARRRASAQQLWIPVGFAHGFCVLSDVADFVYKCHELLRPGDRGGLQLRRPRRRHRVAGRAS